MQLIYLTLVNFLFFLCCSAGPIAHLVPRIRDSGPGDESAHIFQPSSLALHYLQGSVSSETDDLLTVIPVTPSLTHSPLVPDTSSADHTHSTTQSVDQPSASAPVFSHTIATTAQSTISVFTASDDHFTSRLSQETTSTSIPDPTPESSMTTPSQSSPTVHGHTDIISSSQDSAESPSHTSHHVPSGPSLTVHTLSSVRSPGLHPTMSTPISSAPQLSGQKPSGASATVSKPAMHSSELQSTGFPSILPTSLNSAQSLSVSGPLNSPHGTVHRTKSTEHGTPLSPSLSSHLTPTTPSSPTGSVTTSTTTHSPKSPAPTAISTSLSVGVVGLLPGELSGGDSTSVLPDPAETTNLAHLKSVATGSILNIGKPSVSLPTGFSTTAPFPGESTSQLSSSAQTQKMPPSSNGDNFPTGTATTISGSAQKEPSSFNSSQLPISNKHTATSVSDPVIVIVTPGQSTSWTNTWLRVSDRTSTSSQSSSAITATTSHTTLRPSGTIAIPEIPTGPSRDPETSNPEPTAPHTHSRLSKGTDTATTIHAISTVTKVVTVPASDEPEAPAPTETKDPQTAQEPKATATQNQTRKASDIPNPPPPSRKTKPTAETGVPATESSITSVAQPTGVIDDALLRGLQVVPVTPQGFITVTETKTETTTKTKTETETETETQTVYMNPTFTITAGS